MRSMRRRWTSRARTESVKALGAGLLCGNKSIVFFRQGGEFIEARAGHMTSFPVLDLLTRASGLARPSLPMAGYHQYGGLR
jgi:hypothetical protein